MINALVQNRATQEVNLSVPGEVQPGATQVGRHIKTPSKVKADVYSIGSRQAISPLI